MNKYLLKFVVPILFVLLLIPGLKAQEYSPLDTMIKARDNYEMGLHGCDAIGLMRAGEMYRRCYDTLTKDVLGLGFQFNELINKSAYMTAWCYFRRSEITGDVDLLDSAKIWFKLIPIDAPESLGIYAAYMSVECDIRKTVTAKYDYLCHSLLTDDIAGEMQIKHESSIHDLQGAAGAIDKSEPLLKAVFELRMEDIIFEQAKLSLAIGRADEALMHFDNIDYEGVNKLSIEAGSIPAVEAIIKYNEVSVLLEKYLITQDSLIGDAIENRMSAFGSDANFRKACKLLRDEDFYAAAKLFEKVADEDNIAEANYWSGFTYLITCTEPAPPKGMTTEGVLKKSRDRFEKFIDWMSSNNIEGGRLGHLLTSAEQKIFLIKIPLDKSLSDSDRSKLYTQGRDNIKFLIRLTASMVGDIKRRSIKRLLDYFDHLTNPDVRRDNNTSHCTSAEEAPFTDSEIRFYKGLVQTMYAEYEGYNRALLTQALQTLDMDKLSDKYKAEAEYVRGKCLYNSRKYDDAAVAFKDLVKRYGSVRSLYWLGMNYYDKKLHAGDDGLNKTDSSKVCWAMTKVKDAIEQAGKPPIYGIFLADAEAMLNPKTGLGGVRDFTHSLDVDISRLKCPESLLVDSTGIRPETIFYETLADKKLIKWKFTTECIDELQVYGLPKRSLYPNNRSCTMGRAFANDFKPIADDVYLDDDFTPNIVFFGEDGSPIPYVDSCLGENLQTDTIYAWHFGQPIAFDEPVNLNDTIQLKIYKNGYYPLLCKITSSKPGNITFDIALSTKVTYKQDVDEYCISDSTCISGSNGRNTVLLNIDPDKSSWPPDVKESFETMSECFKTSPSVRDFAYDTRNKCFIGIDFRLEKSILVCDTRDKIDTAGLLFMGDALGSLNSPEGIGVDSDGNLYIADRGNHRVVKFRRENRYRYSFVESFGTFGENTGDAVFQEAKFIFPTRVAIEEKAMIDTASSAVPERHIIVADRYGIHKLDSHGRYLDTPIERNDVKSSMDSFYAIRILGYGAKSKLQYLDRTTDKVHYYSAKK